MVTCHFHNEEKKQGTKNVITSKP